MSLFPRGKRLLSKCASKVLLQLPISHPFNPFSTLTTKMVFIFREFSITSLLKTLWQTPTAYNPTPKQGNWLCDLVPIHPPQTLLSLLSPSGTFCSSMWSSWSCLATTLEAWVLCFGSLFFLLFPEPASIPLPLSCHQWNDFPTRNHCFCCAFVSWCSFQLPCG